jgi:hypothetical protein
VLLSDLASLEWQESILGMEIDWLYINGDMEDEFNHAATNVPWRILATVSRIALCTMHAGVELRARCLRRILSHVDFQDLFAALNQFIVIFLTW